MTVKPIILDGAMGTELIQRGVECPLPLWSADANLTHPEIVKKIHIDYINAGASVITTNTFRTTSWTYQKIGLSNKKAKLKAKNSLYKAVEVAHQAKQDSVRIAGSITAIDDCYLPGNYPGNSVAEEIYGNSLEWLDDAGVNLILFETMGNINEISIALKLSQHIQLPIWLSLIMKDQYRILDGTSLKKVISIIPEKDVNCLLVNCNKMDINLDIIGELGREWNCAWGSYPNLGKSDYENDYFDRIDESNFSIGISSILQKNPDVIGVCCGSTPNHIKQIKSFIEKIDYSKD
jgi:homocysteine S-methyltransferase